ncbi:MAG TPA: 16S rRNA processing protein RimM [Eubacterium sp.]|jgi:16S rRNA processing protein RimM|nr:16S rRNA processing protein RimM [Eubacterium sp.]
MVEYLRVGVLQKPHGIHGEVKVYPTTSDLDRYDELKEVYLEKGDKRIATEVEQVKYFKGLAIVKLKGIDTPEDMIKFQGYDLMIHRSDATPLGEDENYIGDLIGLVAYDESGNKVGVLKDVYETGAKDVYVFAREGKQDLLLPAIKDCILKVDVEAGTILIRIMKGLDD